MTGEIIVILAGLIFVGALLDGARCDLASFRIPNRVPVVVALAFLPAGLAAGLSGAEWLSHLGAGLIMLGIGAGLFALGVWGGGDAKLVPAVCLWLGFGSLTRFLLIMAAFGGGLALLALVARRVPLGPEGPVRAWGRRMADSGHVPYGLAIAAAGLDWWIPAMARHWPW